MPERSNVVKLNRGPTLRDLRAIPMWVSWVLRGGKRVPISPRDGKDVNPLEDKGRFGTFEQAIKLNGNVGIILGLHRYEGKLIIGIDLDGCLDGDDNPEDRARQVVDRAGSYTEASPSGTGLHILCFAPDDIDSLGIPHSRKFKDEGEHEGIELYRRGYFTVTENRFESRRVLRQVSLADLKWLIEEIGPQYKKGSTSSTTRKEDAIILPKVLPKVDVDSLNIKVIAKLRTCKNNADKNGRLVTVARAMVAEGYDNAMIAAMLWTKGEPVSEHLYETLTTDKERDRAVRRAIATAREGTPALKTMGVTFLKDIESKDVQYLRPSLPRGTVIMFAGNSGVGKSSVLYDLLSCLSKGRPWPPNIDKTKKYKSETVLLLNYEDPAAQIIKPRMELAGADMSKVGLIDMVEVNGKRRAFSIADDLSQLENLITTYKPSLVDIDPVSAFMGARGLRDHGRSATDVRSTLDPLAELAQRTGTTICLVSHFRKNADGANDILHMVNDSQAYTALPRVVFVCGLDPDDFEHRVMLTAKNQFQKYSTWLNLGYRLSDRNGVSQVTWDEEQTDVTPQDLIGKRERGRPKSASIDAKAFLEGLLKKGPMPVSDIVMQAEARAITRGTLYNARKELDLKKCWVEDKVAWKLRDENKE